MKNYKYISIAIIVLAFVSAITLVAFKGAQPVQGSISTVDGYYGTTTNGIYAAATSTYIRVGPGSFGSIVVGSSSAATIEVRDATSTTDVSSTTIARLGASPTSGTYTYDVSFARGLFLVFPAGFNGSYTVTYK